VEQRQALAKISENGLMPRAESEIEHPGRSYVRRFDGPNGSQHLQGATLTVNRLIKLSAATLACAFAIIAIQTAEAQVSAPTTAPVVNPAVVQKGNGAHRLAKMARELGLSAGQKGQIKAILKANAQQRKAIRNSQIPVVQQKAQIKALRQTTRQQVGQVLTPDQRARWQQLHKAHKP
jgi:Spy/CpxP family protein refolding chaperone